MLGQWPRVSRGEGEAGQAFSANQQLRREERRAEGRQSPRNFKTEQEKRESHGQQPGSGGAGPLRRWEPFVILSGMAGTLAATSEKSRYLSLAV